MKHYKPESHVGFDHVEMCHAVAIRSARGALHHVRCILRAPQCRNRPTCHQIYKQCSCYTQLFHMTQWPLLPQYTVTRQSICVIQCESISFHDEKSIPQLTEVAINRVTCYVYLTVILKKFLNLQWCTKNLGMSRKAIHNFSSNPDDKQTERH